MIRKCQSRIFSPQEIVKNSLKMTMDRWNCDRAGKPRFKIPIENLHYAALSINYLMNMTRKRLEL
jgi:hypothetical protein